MLVIYSFSNFASFPMTESPFTKENTEDIPVDGLAILDSQLLGKLKNNNYICNV